MIKNVIGLMSGTSMDGVDAAYLKTNGINIIETGMAITLPYGESFRNELSEIVSKGVYSKNVESQITNIHADAVKHLIKKNGDARGSVDLIGFSGHTIYHIPNEKKTFQIGDGAMLADLTGIDVVSDFRSNDMINGGQGAPIAPVYHQVLANNLKKPVVILNIGGVANITYIGDDDQLISFDTGPGNALIDDFIFFRLGYRQDTGGKLALSGKPDKKILESLMDNEYFSLNIPKSLDRNQFSFTTTNELSDADGAATLTAFTAESIARSKNFLPKIPFLWLVTGGGRYNEAILLELRSRLGENVKTVEEVGWKGDAIEAQAFAYLAVRSVLGLPLSFPSTTGVNSPVSGGKLFLAS